MDNVKFKRKKVIEVGPSEYQRSVVRQAKLIGTGVTSVPVVVRQANEDDVNFLFNSWLRSFRGSGSLAKGVVNTVYFTEHHKVIEKILKTAAVYVAVDPEDSKNIYGWVCFEYIEGVFCLHFAYVKHIYRGLGIATTLLSKSGHDFSKPSIHTHSNDKALTLSTRKNSVYHPYILMNYEGKEPDTSNMEDPNIAPSRED